MRGRPRDRRLSHVHPPAAGVPATRCVRGGEPVRGKADAPAKRSRRAFIRRSPSAPRPGSPPRVVCVVGSRCGAKPTLFQRNEAAGPSYGGVHPPRGAGQSQCCSSETKPRAFIRRSPSAPRSGAKRMLFTAKRSRRPHTAESIRPAERGKANAVPAKRSHRVFIRRSFARRARLGCLPDFADRIRRLASAIRSTLLASSSASNRTSGRAARRRRVTSRRAKQRPIGMA